MRSGLVLSACYAAISICLPSPTAAQQACVLRADHVDLERVVVAPSGGEQISFAIRDTAIELHIAPSERGFLVERPLRFRAYLDGIHGRLPYRLTQEVSAHGGIVTLLAGEAIESVAAGERGPVVTIGRGGYELALRGIPVPCAALAIGSITTSAPSAGPRATRPVPRPRPIEDGTRWLSASETLTLRARPGDGESFALPLGSAREVFVWARIAQQDGWAHVTGRGHGFVVEGWVRQDELTAHDPDRRLGIGAIGRDRSACEGVRASDDEGVVYRGRARVRAGAEVHAGPGNGRWATVPRSAALAVRWRAGERWVAITALPGLVQYDRAGHCRGEIDHAWVPLDAVTIPGRARLEAAAAQRAPTTVRTTAPAEIARLRAAAGLDRNGLLAVGGGHVCAVRAGGTVACRGENAAGQLGDGTTTPRDRFSPIAGAIQATQLCAGRDHTCALRPDGRIACWGRYPGVADPRSPPSPPTDITGIADAIEITCGLDHICALRRDGRVACWGSNRRGQLGDGTDDDRSQPVDAVALGDAIQVAAGHHHTCALSSTGRVSCWGSNDGLALGARIDGPDSRRPVLVVDLADAVSVAASRGRSCAVRRAGTVVCWGSNTDGHIGNHTAGYRDVPAPLEIPRLTGVVQVSMAEDATCARTGAGEVVCWGAGDDGQMGDGEGGRMQPLSPIAELRGVTQIASSAERACAIDGSGTVRCWGVWTVHDPVAVEGIGPASQLSIGFRHACVRLRTGAVACWLPRAGSPSSAMAGTGWRSVAAGVAETCAVDRQGRPFCTQQPLPLAGISQLELTTGGGCAVLRTGAVWCWNERRAPAAVAGISGAIGISIDGQQRCAVTRAGGVMCWRDDSSSDSVPPTPPAAIAGLRNVVQVSVRLTDACARQRDGAVLCWPTRAPQPVRVAVSDAVSIDGDYYGFCAARRSGAVACWGIAPGPGPHRWSTPVAQPGFADAESVAVGHDHACAIRRDGRVSCWGRDVRGLVTGTSAPRRFE